MIAQSSNKKYVDGNFSWRVIPFGSIFFAIFIALTPMTLFCEDSGQNNNVESEEIDLDAINELLSNFLEQSDFSDFDLGKDSVEDKEVYPGGPWQFIEDELLLVPGYPALLVFIPVGFGSGSGKIVSKWIRGKWKGSGRASAQPRGLGWKESVARICFDGAIGSIVGLTAGRVYKALLYSTSLIRFFRNWDEKKKLIPEPLYVFLEKEYKRFVREGYSYFLWHTSRVVRMVENAVELHKANIRVSSSGPEVIPPEIGELLE